MEHISTIKAADFVVRLRSVLGLPPLEVSPALDIPAHMPANLVAYGVNVRWLIAWAVAGLQLFEGAQMPSMAASIIVAKRTVATLAMDDTCGRIKPAAKVLRTGRPNLRRTLEEAGVLPWNDPFDRHPPVEPVAWCRCAGRDKTAA